jgi:hypothetical protein
LEHEFYFEAMLIVYAMMEDRMRSFLYHIGAFRQPDARRLNVSKTKGDLRRLYFGSDEAAENKKLTFDNISCKEKMIRATLNWAISSDSIVSGTWSQLEKTPQGQGVGCGIFQAADRKESTLPGLSQGTRRNAGVGKGTEKYWIVLRRRKRRTGKAADPINESRRGF